MVAISRTSRRTARHRLDTAVGPANWECRVEPAADWVKSVITITLPDGRTVSREALSGYPDVPPGAAGTGGRAGDRIKAADSTAFKRAAAMFGVGSYLYGDVLPPGRPAGPTPGQPPAGHAVSRRQQPTTRSPEVTIPGVRPRQCRCPGR